MDCKRILSPNTSVARVLIWRKLFFFFWGYETKETFGWSAMFLEQKGSRVWGTELQTFFHLQSSTWPERKDHIPAPLQLMGNTPPMGWESYLRNPNWPAPLIKATDYVICVALAACSQGAGCLLSFGAMQAQIKETFLALQILKSKFMAHPIAYRKTTWGRHRGLAAMPYCTPSQAQYLQNSHASMPTCASPNV